jgi:uncharacterized membrane protein YeiH
MLGGSLFILLHWLNWSDTNATIVAVSAALTLRLAAIYWHVSLPAFSIIETPKTNVKKDPVDKNDIK